MHEIDKMSTYERQASHIEPTSSISFILLGLHAVVLMNL